MLTKSASFTRGKSSETPTSFPSDNRSETPENLQRGRSFVKSESKSEIQRENTVYEGGESDRIDVAGTVDGKDIHNASLEAVIDDESQLKSEKKKQLQKSKAAKLDSMLDSMSRFDNVATPGRRINQTTNINITTPGSGPAMQASVLSASKSVLKSYKTPASVRSSRLGLSRNVRPKTDKKLAAPMVTTDENGADDQQTCSEMTSQCSEKSAISLCDDNALALSENERSHIYKGVVCQSEHEINKTDHSNKVESDSNLDSQASEQSHQNVSQKRGRRSLKRGKTAKNNKRNPKLNPDNVHDNKNKPLDCEEIKPVNTGEPLEKITGEKPASKKRKTDEDSIITESDFQIEEPTSKRRRSLRTRRT